MNRAELVLRQEAYRIQKASKEPDVMQLRMMGYHPRPELSRPYQCPACWMRNEIHSDLDPIPTGTRDDAFRCDRCGADFLVDRP